MTDTIFIKLIEKQEITDNVIIKQEDCSQVNDNFKNEIKVKESLQDSEQIPCPGNANIIKLKDSDFASYKYIEFPEDTIFLEAIAQNSIYKKGIAYIPAQRLVEYHATNGGKIFKKETHLYAVAPHMTHAQHIAGPIATPCGSTEISIFGSHLNSQGILYMCAFNRNSILALDLTKLTEPPVFVECQFEIANIPAPNDLCIDPHNENVLYVAAGKMETMCCFDYKISNASSGTIYKVTIITTNTDDGSSSSNNGRYFRTEIQARGLDTLAGIEVINDQIVTAQLYNVIMQNKQFLESSTIVNWEGYDYQGNVWLADNIDTFSTTDCSGEGNNEEKLLVIPA